MAKQVKRKSGSRTHHASESDTKKPKLKQGRKQLRTVTRTARRPDRDAENDEETGYNDEREKLDQSEDESDEEKEGNADANDDLQEDKGKAYDALLTLLKSDHKEPKKQKNKASSYENTEEADANDENDDDIDIEDDEIAGVNVALDKDEEIEDESADEDDIEDTVKGLEQDPFEVHFNLIEDSYIDTEEKLVIKEREKWSIESKNSYPELGYSTLMQVPPGSSIPITSHTKKLSIDKYPLKKRVQDAWGKHFPSDFEELSELDRTLLEPMLNYVDINFPYKSFQNTSYRKLYALHALNHIYKTRDRIIKNSGKLHVFKETMKNGGPKFESQEPEFRDQGFTRPKVLILLPTRNACYELVELIIKLSGLEQQENKKKFNKQFFAKEVPPENKPSDFRDSFKGNNNDFFCIGLKFTRKTLKLYSSFYSSDIIIASPIGLSMILENPDKKKRQYDFISSIEVLIVDRANQIEMQNWENVSTVMKYVNKIPKDFHDADFSRIRMWSINDQSKLLRQTLIFSEFLTPNINNLITSKSFNLAGKMKFKPLINSSTCIMNSIGLKLKQIFQRFESPSPLQDPESRFKFFINSVLPSLIKSSSYSNGILIFIPSYYDYLRVKHYMKTSTKLNVGSLDEYSSQSKTTRVRQQFQSGKIDILLYTERLHYFRRFEISGVKTLLMYGLPSIPVFYKELVRFIGKSVFKEQCDLDLAFVKILFSKWDAVTLERVVGNERAPALCNSVNELFEFR
ncbi:U3 snoRNA-associated protein 25 [Scheffersomyces xylosifermentans]|uniref:U3 snoRNA-associated protein 25 n=1 Tax=Scheffersomyces xylosifermentans TaxID=1304137 RepID=UPI00315C701B